jgi:hypothetical protein
MTSRLIRLLLAGLVFVTPTAAYAHATVFTDFLGQRSFFV